MPLTSGTRMNPRPPSSSARAVRARFPPVSWVLLRFFVDRVLVAEAAELLLFHPTRMLFPVLRRRVVPAFAVGAFKRDNVSHSHASDML